MESIDCSRRFRCLLCSDTIVFDNRTSLNIHRDHPKQPLISNDLLLAKFGAKANGLEHYEINVYNCPYCDRQQLSISTLYDHLTLKHLDVPFSVRCPVCVCFRRGKVSILNDVHLTQHLAEQHCSTLEQYQEHISFYNIYGDGECELLQFIASTLPPTYCENESLKNQPEDTKTAGQVCSICLDVVCEENYRELSCKHKFHAKCIDPWTAQNATCPVCRTPVR